MGRVAEVVLGRLVDAIARQPDYDELVDLVRAGEDPGPMIVRLAAELRVVTDRAEILTAQRRRLFVAAAEAGMTQGQIAGLAGISGAQVSKAISKATAETTSTAP